MSKTSASKKGADDESKVPRKLDFTPNPEHLDGVPDMSALIYLEEGNVVHNLRCRYRSKEIYTNIQSIMIAVNPYESIPIYADAVMEQYRGKKRADIARLPPHCYAVAELSYQDLAKNKANQSMVICGESGSGKTESAKVFMRYLAHVTGHHSETEMKNSIEQRFLQANPVLEAFGNAQTNMNNNSSRFGKFTKVLFEHKENSPKGYRPGIVGSFVETYLLEKSRVIFQEQGERNYHIFYQLVKGASGDLAAKLKLDSSNLGSYRYIGHSGVYDIVGVSDEEKFADLNRAMDDLSFGDKREQVFQTVAGLLHLSNVDFRSPDGEVSEVDEKCKESLDTASSLFGVSPDDLAKRLTTSSIKVGAQLIAKPLKKEEAQYNRDAIAKALYQGMFNQIVTHINSQLVMEKGSEKDTLWIGILDVFGFESFDFNNSFEQLCINFANEKLQQYFNSNVVQAEQEEYLREALPWTPLEIQDNQSTIDLIEGKPNGILATLDSACVMPKGSDDIFMQNLMDANRKHASIKQARQRPKPKESTNVVAAGTKKYQRERFNGFYVHHYAGSVCYNSQGFLDKNNDSLHDETVKLFSSSSVALMQRVLDPDGTAATKTKKRSFSSVGTHFQKQLTSLMQTLQSTTPHFVRCINPNQFKRPEMFDAEYVVPQLRCGGLMEALKILKLGYPSRTTYASIFERYGHILPNKAAGKSDAGSVVQKDFCEAIFMAFGAKPADYQFGLTKVFFKPGKQEFLETIMSQGAISDEMKERIQQLMVKNRIRRVRAAAILLARMQAMANRLRSYRKLLRTLRIAVVVAKAVSKPMAHIKRLRAAKTIQAAVRVHYARVEFNTKVKSAAVLQRLVLRTYRKRHLRAELAKRMADTNAKQNSAASRIQVLCSRTIRRKTLTTEITKRVEETRKRLEHQARLEAAKREEEERERRRKQEEERERERKAEEERKKREEEEAKRREEEEAKRKADEEAKRAEEEKRREAEAIALREKMESERKAEEERKKKDKEEMERKAAEEEERKRKAEQEKKDRADKERQFQEMLDKRQREKEDAIAAQREAEAKEREAREAAQAEKEKQTRLAAVNEDEDEPGTSKDGIAIPSYIQQNYPEAERLVAMHLAERKQQQAEQIAKQYRLVLVNGAKFLKFGKRGQPHIRHVTLNMLGNLHWDQHPMDPNHLFPSPSFVKLLEIISVQPGKQTAVLKRKVARNAPDNLCFSVVTTERTLDLQAINVQERDLWVRAIQSAVQDAQKGVVNFITGAKNPEESALPVRKPTDDDKQAEMSAPKARLARAQSMRVSSKVVARPSLPASFRPDGTPSTATGGGTVKGAPSMRRVSLSSAANKQLDISRSRQDSDLVSAADTEVSYSEVDDDDYYVHVDIQKGDHMLHFGQVGTPRVLHLRVDPEQDTLHLSSEERGSSSQSVSFKLVDIQKIHSGKQTRILQTRSTNALSPVNCCFSLMLKTRSLDFQTESEEKRDAWVSRLHAAVKKAKGRAHSEYQNRQKQKQALAKATQKSKSTIHPLKRSQSVMLPRSVRMRASVIDGREVYSPEADPVAASRRAGITDSKVFEPPSTADSEEQ